MKGKRAPLDVDPEVAIGVHWIKVHGGEKEQFALAAGVDVLPNGDGRRVQEEEHGICRAALWAAQVRGGQEERPRPAPEDFQLECVNVAFVAFGPKRSATFCAVESCAEIPTVSRDRFEAILHRDCIEIGLVGPRYVGATIWRKDHTVFVQIRRKVEPHSVFSVPAFELRYGNLTYFLGVKVCHGARPPGNDLQPYLHHTNDVLQAMTLAKWCLI